MEGLVSTVIAAIAKGAVSAFVAPIMRIYQSWKDRQQGRADQVASEQADLSRAEANALKAATDTTGDSVDGQLRDGKF